METAGQVLHPLQYHTPPEASERGHMLLKKNYSIVAYLETQSDEVQQCFSDMLSAAIVTCVASPEVLAEYSVLNLDVST